MTAGALSPQDVDTLFADLKPYTQVALAVSGGSDSMALMTLACEWARRATDAPSLIVLTVDHRMRPDSRQEAEWVGAQAKAAGLAHHILNWENAPAHPSQDKARAARYDLLSGFARAHDIQAIVTAHTRDDVAETFLMRLARGSGVDGLSAMARRTTWGSIALLRPLLDLGRAQLRTQLTARGATWIEDPSNADERFERVRVRSALGVLSDIGIPPARIAESAKRLRRTRRAIEEIVRKFITTEVEVSPAGYARLSLSTLLARPDEVVLHIVKQLIGWVGGQARPVRLRKLEILAGQLRRGSHVTTTVGGCLIAVRTDHNALTICREPGRLRAAPVTLGPGQTAVWDQRFCMKARPDAIDTVRVNALGAPNVAALPEQLRKLHPLPALACLPALYANDMLIGVPVPGFAISDQDPAAEAFEATFLPHGHKRSRI